MRSARGDPKGIRLKPASPKIRRYPGSPNASTHPDRPDRQARCRGDRVARGFGPAGLLQVAEPGAADVADGVGVEEATHEHVPISGDPGTEGLPVPE